MKKLLLFLFSISLAFALPSFLMPEDAFKPHATLNSQMQIEANIELAQSIYLYADKTKLELLDENGITIKNINSPQSIDHDGDIAYVTSPSFIVTLQKDSSVSGTQKVKLKISYQGCSEKGLCYEPLSQTFELDVDTSKLLSAKVKEQLPLLNLETLTIPKQIKEVTKNVEVSETDAIADTIKNGNIPIILLTFLGFGLLLALTPCVFPMIPIISGVIISQGKDITTRKALMLSIVYVLAMAVAYTFAGVLAGLFGANLQAALQNPWVIYSFSGVFVALAFSMFGFYELKLPDSLVAKVSSVGGNKGGYIGVAIMGFLSALIVGPCVAAPLAGALVYIGQTGDALLGGMALFAMSIGMGLPLIVVGVSAGKFMPKPGMWMTMVSAVFGVMMLGVAVWMLERIVDEYITMLLYAMLGIGFAIYLGALEKGGHIFKKSVAIILFIYSLSLLIGVLAGATSLAKPLEFLKPQAVTSMVTSKTTHAAFTKVTSIKELDILLKKNKGKKILLDFSAEWCTACKELEEVTFSNSAVKNKMDEFVLIQADITENSAENKALSKKYGVFGPPALLFFKESGELQSARTIIGFIKPEPFLKHLNAL
ncbi:MAG: thiol:disulfide interchange protein DsbD [Sulfurimonas sp.]|jgi:thiol:disulfide interchange protein DsbD|uniref:protein-disulfide reductase DsbD n=1 Tax=Sulfurimonas sp. TaxID=2022749 RepID=UPI0039E29442